MNYDILKDSRDALRIMYPDTPSDVRSFDIQTGFRLQQLREEFEAARDGATFGWDWWLQGAPPYSLEEWSRFKRDEQWPAMSDVADSARHYIIARDFGEVDRKKALMIWKLQRQ